MTPKLRQECTKNPAAQGRFKQCRQYDFERASLKSELSQDSELTPNPASKFVSFKIDGIESEGIILFSVQNTKRKVMLKSQIQNLTH